LKDSSGTDAQRDIKHERLYNDTELAGYALEQTRIEYQDLSKRQDMLFERMVELEAELFRLAIEVNEEFGVKRSQAVVSKLET
jgi:hypothetical protein